MKKLLLSLASVTCLALAGCESNFANRVKIDAGAFGKLDWTLGAQPCEPHDTNPVQIIILTNVTAGGPVTPAASLTNAPTPKK